MYCTSAGVRTGVEKVRKAARTSCPIELRGDVRVLLPFADPRPSVYRRSTGSAESPTFPSGD